MLDPLAFVVPGTEQVGACPLRQGRRNLPDDDGRRFSRPDPVPFHHVLTIGPELLFVRAMGGKVEDAMPLGRMSAQPPPDALERSERVFQFRAVGNQQARLRAQYSSA